MLTIRPEFNSCVHWQLAAAADTGSESDSKAQGILSLEMRDDPFRSLIRRIDRLSDTGLREDMLLALELTRTALFEGIFEDKQEQKLTERLAALVELLRVERGPQPGFPPPVLQ